MRYFSDKLNKFFDTPEACEEAETKASIKENSTNTSGISQETPVDTEKQTYIDNIVKFEAACKDAYDNCVKFDKDAKEIKAELEKARKETYGNYTDALDAKRKAIMEYNKKYGPYKSTDGVTYYYSDTHIGNPIWKIFSLF